MTVCDIVVKRQRPVLDSKPKLLNESCIQARHFIHTYILCSFFFLESSENIVQNRILVLHAKESA
jgi:hypothetical protein